MIPRFFSNKKPTADRLMWVLMCVSLGLQSYSASAETLNLDQAVRNAIKQHPSLTAYNYRLQGADGTIAQSRVGTRKSINFNVENALGTGNFNGLDSAETTLGVTWVLEGELLDAKEQRARENKSLIELQKDIKRLDIASNTASRFIAALIYQEKLKVAKRWEKDALNMYRHILRRVDAGKSPLADKYRARAELSLSELKLEDVEHEIETAYVQLSALWGSSTPSFNYLAGDAANVGSLPGFSTLKAQLENNPDLDIFLTQERIAQSEINLAKAESKNRWQFNTGVRHFAATDDVGFVAGFNIPLGAKKRSKGKIAALNASVSAYQNDAMALRIQLEAELFKLYQAYKHARHEIDTLSNKTIPDIERALLETQKAYDLGRSGFQEWTLIQKELLENKLRLLEAYYSAHINRIEIERLSGTSITALVEVENQAQTGFKYSNIK